MEIKNQDFENLSKEELVYILKNIKYGLTWSANENTKEHFEKESENAYPVLKGVPEKDILTDKEKPTNLLIEGDNYHVLSVMQYTHQNSIDVIYIDPPYNTGNKDFVYNDRFVDKEDGWRHSKWLSFMNKRLRLARELLKDDGVIFISIDDNEQAQLKLLCDEVFGENNFIATVPTVRNLKGKNDTFGFANIHEYLLVYSKQINKCNLNGLGLDKDEISSYKHEDEYGKFKKGASLQRTGVDAPREKRPNLYYPIFITENNDIIVTEDDTPPNIKEKYITLYPMSKGYEMSWLWKKEKVKNEVFNLMVVGKGKNKKLYKKQRLNVNGQERLKKPKSIMINPKYDSSNGTNLLKDIFGERIFNNPKPIELIKDILTMAVINKPNSIILDFFAGSGTTGHAVMELNKEDGGNRQFILVTNNENNICTDVTHPRIQKVIEGYTTPKGKEVEGLGGNLKYYKTDFVQKNANSDQMLDNLVEKCTDILCIKENVFELVSDKRFYQIYQSNEKTMAVFTGTRTTKRLQKLQEELSQFDGEKVLYCFTLNPTGIEIESEIYELFKGIRIEPIPHKIKNMLEEAMNLCK